MPSCRHDGSCHCQMQLQATAAVCIASRCDGGGGLLSRHGNAVAVRLQGRHELWCRNFVVGE